MKQRFVLLGFWVVCLGSGCAETASQNLQQVNLQQSSTITSLQAEITRLNQEIDGTVQSRQDFQKVSSRLESLFSREIARGDIRVIRDTRGIAVILFDRTLFDPEEATLLPSGTEYLDKLAGFLVKEVASNPIVLEGHTDNQPVEGSEGITNWEYSMGRAMAVLHYFVDTKGVPPERFTVSGFGEYRPLDSNATAEGQERNRRVEVVILPEKVADVSAA